MKSQFLPPSDDWVMRRSGFLFAILDVVKTDRPLPFGNRPIILSTGIPLKHRHSLFRMEKKKNLSEEGKTSSNLHRILSSPWCQWVPLSVCI